jgi:hypothetical protein
VAQMGHGRDEGFGRLFIEIDLVDETVQQTTRHRF